MPLVTYADLTAAVASWLARDDLAAAIPDFVAIFEATANRRLRVRQMLASAVLTPAGGSAPLPADYLAWRRVAASGPPPRELEAVHPSWLRAAFPEAEQGAPRAFAVEGEALAVRPAGGGTLVLDYFRKIPPLAEGGNWLWAAHPDLYLFGALAEAQVFLADAAKAGYFAARRDALFDAVERLDQAGRAPAAVRVMGTIA